MIKYCSKQFFEVSYSQIKSQYWYVRPQLPMIGVALNQYKTIDEVKSISTKSLFLPQQNTDEDASDSTAHKIVGDTIWNQIFLPVRPHYVQL